MPLLSSAVFSSSANPLKGDFLVRGLLIHLQSMLISYRMSALWLAPAQISPLPTREGSKCLWGRTIVSWLNMLGLWNSNRFSKISRKYTMQLWGQQPAWRFSRVLIEALPQTICFHWVPFGGSLRVSAKSFWLSQPLAPPWCDCRESVTQEAKLEW